AALVDRRDADQRAQRLGCACADKTGAQRAAGHGVARGGRRAAGSRAARARPAAAGGSEERGCGEHCARRSAEQRLARHAGVKELLVGHRILQRVDGETVSRHSCTAMPETRVANRTDVSSHLWTTAHGSLAVPRLTVRPVCNRRGMLSYQFRGCNPVFPPTRKDRAVEGTLLASNLGFPEGPVIMPDGGVVFCDGNTGEMKVWKDG